MLASTLSRPRCGMPSTTPSRPSSAADDRISSRIAIADSAPSSPNRFWPTYFVARNFSNASAALSRESRVALLVTRQCEAHAFDLLLDPPLLGGVLDVHVLDADRAAVRVTQDAQDLAELELLRSRRGRP